MAISDKIRHWIRWRSSQAPQLRIDEHATLLTKVPLERSCGPERFAASYSQWGLWYVKQFEPATSAYNLQVGLRLRGDLNRGALERSLQEIVNRHDILRTTFEFDGIQLDEVVVPSYSVSLSFIDLTQVPESSRYIEAYALAASETQATFDVAQLPLFRLKLIRLAAVDHILICVMDHIISDAWSLGLFVRELNALYHAFSVGEASPLAPLPIQYGDYAQWQRECISGGLFDSQIAYWKSKLRGTPAVLDLHTDRVRPAKQTFDGASQVLPLPKDLVRLLKSLATQLDATLFMIALTAFKVLLNLYSRQEDILVGVPMASRSRVETEALMGLFVNVLVLRTNLGGNPRLCDLLLQVREVTLEAFCNSDIPFAKLVEEVKPARNTSYNPIFQAMFAVIKTAVQSESFGGLNASPYLVTSRTSRFDLTMNLIEDADDEWLVQLEYNTTLFDHERMTGMLRQYLSVLRAMAAQPHMHISDLPLPVSRQKQSAVVSDK
jgi:hypothetical protein